MIYKLYSYIIATPLFVISTFIVAVLIIISSICRCDVLTHKYIPHLWGKMTFMIYLIPVKIYGIEKLDKKQSYIFLANHQGYLDIPLMYGYLNHSFKWMMKDYLKKMPLVGIACMFSRQIFVGDSRASIANAVNNARKTLYGGMSMAIFPEGTRTYDGKMIPFKRGAFMLASEIGLPIVPITINGSFKVFSRQAKSLTRAQLSLIIHEPITSEQCQEKNTKSLMTEVYDIIESGLE